VTDAEYPHLAPWASDGVFQSSSDVVYGNSSDREVHVRAGKYGIVQGHAWYSGASDFVLSIGANTSGSTRVDTVVLRLDRSTWDVTAVVRAGTPGAGAPSLQRDSGDTGLWEIPVANVTVDNGAAVIASGKVTARTLFQSAAIRPCTVITDVQSTLDDGDIVYEAQAGRWIGWTAAGGIVLYEDTGWSTIAGVGFWDPTTAYVPKVRRRNGLVYMKGSFVRTDEHLVSGSPASPVANLPAGFAPAEQHIWMAWTATGGARAQVTATGALQVGDVTDTIPVGNALYVDSTWLAP
jgi:hypothetical protein